MRKTELKKLVRLAYRFHNFMMENNKVDYSDFLECYSIRDIIDMISGNEYYIIVESLNMFDPDIYPEALTLVMHADIFRLRNNIA